MSSISCLNFGAQSQKSRLMTTDCHILPIKCDLSLHLLSNPHFTAFLQQNDDFALDMAEADVTDRYFRWVSGQLVETSKSGIEMARGLNWSVSLIG